MLLPPQNPILTRDRLIAARWRFGKLHEPALTESFCFGADGLIKNYHDSNEHSWSFEDGLLRIFNESGALTWLFEIMFLAGEQLVLIAQYQNDAFWRPFFCLTELGPRAAPADQKPEAVRLVIWDLDDTFWRGTLSEGPVTPVLEHLAMVRTLNERGIISAICSKNDVEPVKKVLRNLGIWDEFVFPEIAFAPKGPMVQRIIENMQLRPESVLFVDDNATNLNEAKFFVPGLQVAGPEILPDLLRDARLAGKPDPEKKRLAHYKVLELKAAEKDAAAGDNDGFLRASDVRISFHTDVDPQFDRIHDLVNRTNQLNFTKNRWPEDKAAAQAAFAAEQAEFDAHGGYVKVADKYGQYGICGYYFVEHGRCRHFLFSCRSMNMGVEQFVYARLGKPQLTVVGDVISDLNRDVDWIRVVADADAENPSPPAAAALTICIRGACDMAMTSNYLRVRAQTLEELTFGWNGWEIASLPRIVAAHQEAMRPENQAILARLPGIPPGRFDSDVLAGTSDAYVLSFSQESFHGLYRSRSTGMILPMGHFSIGQYAREKPDYTKLSFAELAAAQVGGITEQEWEFFQREFEFAGGFNRDLFISDIQMMFGLLRHHGKRVIIVGLNERVGKDDYILGFFANINKIVRPMAEASGFDYIDVAAFIHTLDDLAADTTQGGAHFARHVYAKIADRILEILDK